MIIQSPAGLDCDWAVEFMARWAPRLAIDHWHIHLEIRAVVNEDDANTLAFCHHQTDLDFATIILRIDAHDSEEWRISLLHELLHVAHARIDNVFDCQVLPAVIEPVGMALLAGYKGAVEPFVHHLAHCLYDLAKPADYPEEAP